MMAIGEALKKCSVADKFLLVGDNSFFKYQLKHKIAQNKKIISLNEEDYENSKSLFGNYVYNIKKITDIKKWQDLDDIFPDILILEAETLKPEFNKLNKFMVVNCYSPKLKDQKEDFYKRVTFFCNKKEFKIEESTIAYLHERIGYDLFRLSNELTKLFILCEDKSEITKDAIDEIITLDKENDFFKLKKLIDKKEVNIEELVPFSIKMTTVLDILIQVKENKNYFLLERFYSRDFVEKEVISLVDSVSVDRFYDTYTTLTNILKRVRKKIFDINLIGQYELYKNW